MYIKKLMDELRFKLKSCNYAHETAKIKPVVKSDFEILCEIESGITRAARSGETYFVYNQAISEKVVNKLVVLGYGVISVDDEPHIVWTGKEAPTPYEVLVEGGVEKREAFQKMLSAHFVQHKLN